MKKLFSFVLINVLLISHGYSLEPHTKIIGGGIIGLLEAYYTYQEALKEGKEVSITIYDKGLSFAEGRNGDSTNTAYHITPSLTIDEILAVVPRGSELTSKLSILFNEPGGIRVDDVEGVNDSSSALRFKESVSAYGSNPSHDDRTLALLTLGRRSMDLWQEIYEKGDSSFKKILESSNFNVCREPLHLAGNILHDGYRIDLMYGIEKAKDKAVAMKASYEKMGYAHCAILAPLQVMLIDPELSDFCHQHATIDENGALVWKSDSVALWRPGGCLDAQSFLPKLAAYLKEKMGERFQFCFDKEVSQVDIDEEMNIVGLQFRDGSSERSEGSSYYIFCPGEAIGTLEKMGFQEPAYAAFAGPSLLLRIPLTESQQEKYKHFSHCMEVHGEGIVLAWQARYKEGELFIGVAGTKAFYGDKQPRKEEEFAKNRNLVQLNMINEVLPQFVSLAYGYNTQGKVFGMSDLCALEDKGMARRWVGRRAVAYDGFPTLGGLYHDGNKVTNARCTTHLGSGGVSFAPAAIEMSRSYDRTKKDSFTEKILRYSDSRRLP
jgi:hypothetical protein